MSLLDQEKMLAVEPELSIAVIPNGVDAAYFRPAGGLRRPKDVLFVGYLVHSPNVDALSFYCREFFSLAKEQVPEARLIIAEGGSAGQVEGLTQGADGLLKSYMEDIRPVVDSCRLMVVPLRVGGRTRLEI